MRMQRYLFSFAVVVGILVAARGAHAAPEAAVAPTTHSFGSVHVGSPSVGTDIITVTNNASGGGSDTLTITGLTKEAGNAQCNDFVLTTNPAIPGTGLDLANNGTMTISATFTPGARGARSCVVTVEDNDGNSDTFTLSGTGTAPSMTTSWTGSPGSLSCGSAKVGNGQSTCTVTVSNLSPSNEALDITATITSNPTEYTVTAISQNPIPIGQTATVTVTFDPNNAGTRTGQVTITGDDPGNLSDNVGLTATGTTAILSLPSSVDFGSIHTSTPVLRTLNVQNTGTASMAIDSLTITGTDASSFSFTDHSCSGQTCNPSSDIVVGNGGTEPFVLRCNPATVGAKTATLTVNANNESGTNTVTLNCQGTEPDISVSPTTHTYADTSVGSPRNMTLTINNTATGINADALEYTITKGGADAANFTVSPACTSSCDVPVGGPADSITVTFTPTARRTFNATLTIASDDPDEPSVLVTLSGKGIAPVIGNTTPATLAFGLVDVGANSNPITATIENTGDDVLQISSVAIVGTNLNQFSIVSGTTTAHNIDPGNPDSWQVRCSPTSTGAKSASLRITSNALGASTFDFPLTCTGQQAIFTFSPNPVNFGGVFVGQSGQITARITNTGNKDGTVSSIMSSNGVFTFSVQGGAPPRLVTANGGFIDVDVTFTPLDGTNFTAENLTVTTNGNPASFNIPLRGDGRTVGLDLAIANEADPMVDLGQIRVGVATSRTVTVTNSGDSPMTLSAPSSDDAHCAVQLVSPTSYPASISGNGGTATFNINTTPTALGAGHCDVTVQTPSPTPQTEMISIDFVGVAPGIELINPAAGILDYAGVDVDSSQMQTVQVRNSGDFVLTINNCSIVGSTRFTLATPCTVQQVEIGATASFDVLFDPSLEAAEEAVLRLNSDAFEAPQIDVQLRGVGVDQHINLPITEYMFPPTFRNPDDDDVTEILVRVENPRVNDTNPGAPLTVSMALTETSVQDVFVVPTAGPYTVAAGDEVGIPVQFRPTAVNPNFEGTLTIFNDTTALPMAQVTLRGAGISRSVTVAPGEYDLGTTGVNVPVRLSDLSMGLVVQNTDPDGESYRVRQLAIVDAQGNPVSNASFRVLGADEARDVAAMTSTEYDVEFAPEEAGDFEVLVAVYLDNDPLAHSLVTLRGRAVDVELKGGGGCQAGGGGGIGTLALVAAALLLLSRRRFAGLAVLLVLVPSAARADATRNIDLATFAPVPATEVETFTIESPQVGVNGAWAVDLMLDYSTDVLQVISPQVEGMTDTPISARTAAQVAFAYAFLGQFEAGLRMPFYQQEGSMPAFSGLQPATGNAWGNLAAHVKARLLDGPISLGASLDVTLPTATDDQFAGVGGVSGHVRALAGWRSRRAGVTLNAGFVAREPGELGDIKQGNAVTYGGGAWFRATNKLYAIGELFGSSGMGSPGDGVQQLEGVLGVRFEVVESVGLSVGGGRGIMAGIGAPAARAFLLLDISPRARQPEPLFVAEPAKPRDLGDDDEDGVVNADDQCRGEAEDEDEWQDDDGCPDPDNDGDTILDAADRCPTETEDTDGFDDGDGCVDRDNDNDKIADVDDKCPMEPEDTDGYMDNDGCDEPDNDGDGIPDVIDQCALEPETINGKGDDDGCPDEGDSLVMVMPDRIEIFEPVAFAGTSAKLSRKSANVLGQVAATMRANRDFVRVRVTVHVHPRGGSDQELSEKRAKVVREWLLQWGIEPERVEARGLGSTRPLVPKKQKGAAQLNDRVEFIILEKSVK
jgi:outer membrane protein OmpA-like peptidoglycan-associated protein